MVDVERPSFEIIDDAALLQIKWAIDCYKFLPEDSSLFQQSVAILDYFGIDSSSILKAKQAKKGD